MSPLAAQTRKLAVLQSNYIPWKGYFDLINEVDEFVLYDDMQYTSNDWRNRNRIKTPQGPIWLTIPVATKGHFGQPICDVKVVNDLWRRKHWVALTLNYARAPHFQRYRAAFEALYLDSTEDRLSAINFGFLQTVCDILGIKTRLSWSMDCALDGDRNERLVGLCRQFGATHYRSGPAARAYLDAARFTQAGIDVSYVDYAGYPNYTQLFGDFVHEVSVLDLIFNEGPDAPRFMKSFGQR